MKIISILLCVASLASCRTVAPVAPSDEQVVFDAIRVAESPAPANLRMFWELDEPHPWVLTWDANAEPDIAGYKLRYGTASGSYSIVLDVGNVTEYELMLPCVPPTFVAVNAYNLAGLEGPLSDEYMVTGRDLRLTWDYPGLSEFQVWRSTDLQEWSLAREVSGTTALLRVIPKDLPKEFYRVSVKPPDPLQ